MVEITSEYLASQGLSETFPKRFWNKVKKTDSCWLWTACTDRWGYGYMCRSKGKVIVAPRASWILSCGPIPEGLCVLHNCPNGDNPTCVNPSHLWLGTKAQNMWDKIKKGRQLYGEQIGTHKLTQEMVNKIRESYKTGDVTMQSLADMFGMSLTGIFKVLRNQTWKGMPHLVPNSSPPGVPNIS